MKMLHSGYIYVGSVQFSRSVVSDPLRPHELHGLKLTKLAQGI